MRRLLVLVLALVPVAAAPAAAQEQPPPQQPTESQEQQPGEPATTERRIAAGVHAGGIDVGGLLIEEAAAKLRAEARPRALRTVVVRSAGRRHPLDPVKVAKLKFDALRTAKRAYYAGRDNPPPQPVPGAAYQPLDVPLALRFSRLAVRAFMRDVERKVYRAPRDATLRITLRRMIRRSGRTGRDIDAREAAGRIEAALADPSLPRLIIPKLTKLRPRVGIRDLARRYPTVLTVDRSAFRLRLFKRLRLSRTYGVAVGAAGYETPTGLYRIQNKAVNPVWTAPNKPWAGLYAGRSVPGGSPENPLKARWLGIANGVGIHGTAAEYSIGSRASHGCIRMRVRDVVDLYRRVPVGTPILIR